MRRRNGSATVLKDFEDMRKRQIEHELMREVAARFAADGEIK